MIFCLFFSFFFFTLLNYFSQSTQVHAGIVGFLMDGPVESFKKFIDNLIIETMEKLQSELDKAEEKVDSFVSGAQEWAEKTRNNVHNSLKGILDKVRYSYNDNFFD